MVRFLTRNGCHLCDEARPLVLAAASKTRVQVTEIDIDTDDLLVREYGLRIPVLLGSDDTVLAEGIIEKRDLKRALSALR